MRSILGVASATLVLLALPLAIVASNALGDLAARTTIHFAIGIGVILFAVCLFDFRLPRWATVLAPVGGAVFGGTFVLQGVSEIVGIPGLTWLAFDVLGGPLERVGPDVILVGFVALLLAGSHGLTRVVGWVIVPAVVGLEVAMVAAIPLGIEMPFIKVGFLAPFVWLLLESLKSDGATVPTRRYEVDGRTEALSA